MADIIRINKGLNIPLKGAASATVSDDSRTRRFAIAPDDYPGLKYRLKVAVDDAVEPGTVLLADKKDEKIALVSPIAGKVVEVRRGERRHIDYVVIESAHVAADMLKPAPADFSIDFSSREAAVATLCRSGLWAWLRQRPYDIVPSPEATIRDVFVTAYDSAPLAPDMLSDGMRDDLEAGLEVLAMLTDGRVVLSVPFGSGITSKVAHVYELQGPHPVGNVGVQIAAVKPVNKGETVVTLDARTAVRIGRLKRSGVLDFTADVALTGPGVKIPQHVATIIGASISTLMADRCVEHECANRVISGNVLTGLKVDVIEDFLRYPYRQITVIDEGDTADEFMGWASLSPKKYSVKRSFPAFLLGKSHDYRFDTRLLGGSRAMILSGEYDKVFPFDIYPEFLLKAVIAKDIDRMEKLGIYEVAPEDFALPEFVDTSKIPLQQIVREGLDYLRAETE